MGCTNKCNCSCVPEKGDQGLPGLPGEQGMQGVQGIQGIPGDNGTNGTAIYDSDWKMINNYDAGQGFGLPPYTAGWENAFIRIIGKHVYINGRFMIPLSNDGGTTLITDVSTYPNTNKIYVNVFTGVLGGFETNTAGSITSRQPIIPSELRPTRDHLISSYQQVIRPIRDKAGTLGLNLTTIFPLIYFRTDGKIILNTQKDFDDSGTQPIGGAHVKDNPLHQIISQVSVDDLAPEYLNYKSSYTGAVDNRLSPVSAAQYPATFDGLEETDLGGFFIPFTFNYPLSEAISEADVIAAFNSI